MLLNTIDPSSHLTTNAIGRVSDGALERLKRIHLELANQRLVHVVHHHLGVPAHLRRRSHRFLALKNAAELVKALPPDRSAVVLQGHLHLEFAGQVGQAVVLAARSTGLGGERPVLPPGFPLYRLAAADKGWAVTHIEHRELSA